MHGKFERKSFEGLKELLTALGAAEHFDRASSTPLTTEIKNDGDTWTITRIRPNKTITNTFKIGEVSEFQTLKPGAVAKCSTAIVDKKIVLKAQEKDYVHTIEKDGDNLKETVTVKGLTAVRISAKV